MTVLVILMHAECLLCTWHYCVSHALIYLSVLITLEIENYYEYFIDKEAKGQRG